VTGCLTVFDYLSVTNSDKVLSSLLTQFRSLIVIMIDPEAVENRRKSSMTRLISLAASHYH
jgi:hypothetical protein